MEKFLGNLPKKNEENFSKCVPNRCVINPGYKLNYVPTSERPSEPQIIVTKPAKNFIQLLHNQWLEREAKKKRKAQDEEERPSPEKRVRPVAQRYVIGHALNQEPME